jgi:hypothetical protein
MKDDFYFWLSMAFLAGFSIGVACCLIGANKQWERKLIEKNLAEYNAITGEWQWKEGK